jgi:uncharacterized protein (UPF0332 family)
MLTDDNLTLAKLRLENAYECLKNAEMSIEHGAYKNAATRSYYCIFHAMRAVLALDTFDSKRHSGIISEFRQRYIKTEIFPKEFSNIIRGAYDNRCSSDYNDFYIASKADITEQVNGAKSFLSSVETYINSFSQTSEIVST